jgi:hypothetical protein
MRKALSWRSTRKQIDLVLAHTVSTEAGQTAIRALSHSENASHQRGELSSSKRQRTDCGSPEQGDNATDVNYVSDTADRDFEGTGSRESGGPSEICLDFLFKCNILTNYTDSQGIGYARSRSAGYRCVNYTVSD